MNKLLKAPLFLWFLLFVSCASNDISDKNKRNENWAWWVDEVTGKGMWIPLGNKSTVENGSYTLFYFNGNVYEKGKMKNKKNIDTTFFYDLTGKCFAYQLNLSDTDNVYYYKDGNCKIYFSNGAINCVGIVTNHFRGDQWKSFYKSGRLKSYKNLKQGVGFITEYFENGRKKSLIYSDASQDRNRRLNEWYENGQLALSGSLKDGKYDGIFKRYYENGKLKKSWGMKNDVQDGVILEYYESGQISDSQMVVNDLSQGIGVNWYENGRIKIIANFKDSKFDGLQRAYHSNGNIMLKASMKDDLPEGKFERYDSFGKLTSVELYSNGKRVR